MEGSEERGETRQMKATERRGSAGRGRSWERLERDGGEHRCISSPLLASVGSRREEGGDAGMGRVEGELRHSAETSATGAAHRLL